MKLYLECYPCLLRQALKTAKLIGLNEEDTKAVVDHTLRLLLDDHTNRTAPHVSAGQYAFISKESYKGDAPFDPYCEIKRETNRKVLKYYKRLERIVECSALPLQAAVKVAAAGNIIDFGAKAHGDIDIDHEINNIDNLEFQIFDFQALENKLKTAKEILYIGDNAGEIVFDRILIAEINKEYPEIDIVFAVREMPIINDATLEDAAFTGLSDDVRVISSGSIYPGTVLPETSPEFQRLFNSADIVIAKGQGNYETLSDVEKDDLYFILCIKCDVVAERINAQTGSLILWRKNNG